MWIKKNRFCERNRIGVFGEAVRDLPAVSFTPRLFQTFPQSTPPPHFLPCNHPPQFTTPARSPTTLHITRRCLRTTWVSHSESQVHHFSRVTSLRRFVYVCLLSHLNTQLFHMSASSTVIPSNKCVVHFLLCRRNVCYKLRIGYSAWEKMNVFVCTL